MRGKSHRLTEENPSFAMEAVQVHTAYTTMLSDVGPHLVDSTHTITHQAPTSVLATTVSHWQPHPLHHHPNHCDGYPSLYLTHFFTLTPCADITLTHASVTHPPHSHALSCPTFPYLPDTIIISGNLIGLSPLVNSVSGYSENCEHG